MFQTIFPFPLFVRKFLSNSCKEAIIFLIPIISTSIWDSLKFIVYSTFFRIILVFLAFFGGFPPEQPVYFHSYMKDVFHTRYDMIQYDIIFMILEHNLCHSLFLLLVVVFFRFFHCFCSIRSRRPENDVSEDSLYSLPKMDVDWSVHKRDALQDRSPSLSGCGNHKDSILKSIDKDQRCQCQSVGERAAFSMFSLSKSSLIHPHSSRK